MVFQDYALYPHKTVRGNLLFGMKYNTDLPASAQKDKVEEVASLLGIADRATLQFRCETTDTDAS